MFDLKLDHKKIINKMEAIVNMYG